MKADKKRVIILTKAEVQSGLDRQRYAEGLIRQLPDTHEGRNTWLLNYGVSNEAKAIRDNHHRKVEWDEDRNAAKTISS